MTNGLFIAILCFLVMILPGCTEVDEEVEVISIEIAAVSIATMMIIEDFEVSMITVKILKSDGTFETISINANMLSTDDREKLYMPDTHQIRVSHLFSDVW